MLHGLLVILIFLFVFIAVIAVSALWMVFRGVGRLRDKVFEAMGVDTPGRNPGSDSNRARRRQQTDDRTIIIDNRDPEQARRKIFSRDEGEYVDFEEEK